MKSTVFVVIFLLTSLLASCQRISDRVDHESFQRETKVAGEFLKAGDYDKAMTHYQSALEIAGQMDWIDGIVMSQRNLSEVLTATEQYAAAEDVLLLAKEACKTKKECSSGQLASVYDHLMFIYLFWMKDISRANRLVAEVVEMESKLSETEDIKRILGEYAANMRSAGFEKEARVLENKLK